MANAREKYPDIYVERHEDTRKRQRTVPMQVLSLGYSRTGTMTMKQALEILGIPCWHWISMAENPQDMLMWQEALQRKFEPGPSSDSAGSFGLTEFDMLLGHWGATTDLPAALFAEELIGAYPDAKVVLVERDADRWYESFSGAVIAGVEPLFTRLAAKANPSFLGQMALINDLITKHYFHVDGPRTQWLRNNPHHFKQWRENAKSTYLAHNEMVRRVTPPEKLLLFELERGWAPLCQFLDKPIPDVPFPRVNETAALLEKMNLYAIEAFRRSGRYLIKLLLPVSFILALAAIWWKSVY